MKVTDDIKRAQQQVQDTYDMAMKATQSDRDYLEQIRVQAQKVMKGLIDERIRATKFAKKTEKALHYLGENGWFLDFDMGTSVIGVLARKEITAEELDTYLSEYFENKLEEIEKSIILKHPCREKIIRAAFKAHKNGDYELSIPVLLTQIDGISHKILGYSCYKIKKTAKFVEDQIADSLHKALLYPLAQKLEITKDWNDAEVDFDLLNRHMILHGRNLVYGTRPNSLKVISFINYVVQVLEE